MTRRDAFIRNLIRNRWLYVMLIPGLLYYVLFKYLPMWGVFAAFQDYQPFLGFMNSKWVGLKHFNRLFGDPSFWQLFSNTLMIAVCNLIFYFPVPIILAIMINEMQHKFLKRTIQSVLYMPHFMSWVVIYSLCVILTSPTRNGPIAVLLQNLTGESINILASTSWFRPVVVFQSIWKESGWGTIIFIAALTNIDPQLYEAAITDGANRGQQIWHITLPALRGTIVTLLLLRMGRLLDTGFEQIYLLLNPVNRSIGNVFDTFVYNSGIKQGQYSYSTAVGLFQSVICLILVMSTNWMSRKMGEDGIF